MFGNPLSAPCFSKPTQPNRKTYRCYECGRYFVLIVGLESDWCPQCSLCGSTFVEEYSQVETLPELSQENRRPQIFTHEWGRDQIASSFLERLPVAPSIGSSIYSGPSTTQGRTRYPVTSSNTSSTSLRESSNTWEQVLERLWTAFSRLRSSRREQRRNQAPTSAHTITTTSSTSSSTLYSSSVARDDATGFSTNRVPTRRVRRRTSEDMLDGNSLQDILERELATLYQQLLFTQNDPEEYARMQTLLSSMLDCLFELYSDKSNPTSKSFIDSLEGQLLTEREAKEAESCAICWEDFQPNTRVVFLPCSHLFCKKCICTWLKENATCPTCRYQLPVDDDK